MYATELASLRHVIAIHIQQIQQGIRAAIEIFEIEVDIEI